MAGRVLTTIQRLSSLAPPILSLILLSLPPTRICSFTSIFVKMSSKIETYKNFEVISTTPNLSLADVLKRYELAEEVKYKKEMQKLQSNNVSALYTQQQQPGSSLKSTKHSFNPRSSGSTSFNPNPRQQPRLPVCPTNWDGQTCWYHVNTRSSHTAIDCDGLKEFPRRHLVANNVDPKSVPICAVILLLGLCLVPFLKHKALTASTPPKSLDLLNVQ
ncbi:hypothetical protein L211DRAFT_890841 [Terfezia boudieri ATCC MYA-4762]|uniref:Uncharacterized protein n=1 Tax=Terfezia boudieri ATCC MYA-4762 TaxID=1051890 RepID=A0A3N4M1F7_9PEZI|nr:hypothetical protein L211DRAFT_890841 [Terfezia boudieri ATCC MYA-4762]